MSPRKKIKHTPLTLRIAAIGFILIGIWYFIYQSKIFNQLKIAEIGGSPNISLTTNSVHLSANQIQIKLLQSQQPHK